LPEHQSVDDCRRSLLLPRLKQLVTLRTEVIFGFTYSICPGLKSEFSFSMTRNQPFLCLWYFQGCLKLLQQPTDSRIIVQLLTVGTSDSALICTLQTLKLMYYYYTSHLLHMDSTVICPNVHYTMLNAQNYTHIVKYHTAIQPATNWQQSQLLLTTATNWQRSRL